VRDRAPLPDHCPGKRETGHSARGGRCPPDGRDRFVDFITGRGFVVLVVCHCERVTNTAIETAIAAGADTVSGVADRCRAGSRCGSCRTTIESLLVTRSYETAQSAQPAA
jgi:bacterioferritin-associated ferredoxin